MAQNRQNNNLFDLFANFADLVGNRLVLADQLRDQAESDAYERDQSRIDSEIERNYKRALTQKALAEPAEKPFIPGNAYEMAYHLGQQGLSSDEILGQIAGLQGAIKPGGDKDFNLMEKGRLELGKQYLESRKVPAEYSETEVDFQGRPLRIKDAYMPPLVGQGYNAPDTLMSILSGLPLPVQDSTGTVKPPPTGAPDMNAKLLRYIDEVLGE